MASHGSRSFLVRRTTVIKEVRRLTTVEIFRRKHHICHLDNVEILIACREIFSFSYEESFFEVRSSFFPSERKRFSTEKSFSVCLWKVWSYLLISLPPKKTLSGWKTYHILTPGFSWAYLDAAFWLCILETNVFVEQHCRSQMLQQRPAFFTTKGWRSSLGANIHWCWRAQTLRRSKGAVEEQPDSCAGLEMFCFHLIHVLGRMKNQKNIWVWCVCVVTSKDHETEGLHDSIWIRFCCNLLQNECWHLGSAKPTGLSIIIFKFWFHMRKTFRAITLMASSCEHGKINPGGATTRWCQFCPTIYDGRAFGLVGRCWSSGRAHISEGKQIFKCSVCVAIHFGNGQMSETHTNGASYM